MQTIKKNTVQANGLEFHYLDIGEGPLALCLHGFPDSPWTYRYLLPELAKAGYRAVAPFMRGYAPTQISANGDYETCTLAADAAALHGALGGDKNAVLIGHDWGSVAAIGAATHAPERWRRCVIMSVPPFAVFGQVAFNYDQIKRSFYFWFFQMKISDAIVPGNNMAFIDDLWADWSPGYDAKEDLAHVKDCLRQPANLQAAMGYYRSLFHPDRFGSPDGMAAQNNTWGRTVPQPTLYLHGVQDGCVGLNETTTNSVLDFVGPGSEVVRIQDAGHFLLVEKPAQVNERILQFLGKAQ